MNKLIKIKLALFLSVFFILPLLAQASVSTGAAYLQNNTQDAWATQALVAAGISNVDTGYLVNVSSGLNPTNDYAKAILALAAVGKNPATFGQEDYVAKLKTYYNSNQMGEEGLLNDDIWSILALASIYEVNSPEAIASKNYILASQNTDGGWGYSISSGSDTNDTASAIIALIEAGVSSSNQAIIKALAYLQSTQNDDGGFPYDPGSIYGIDSDSGSGAWVIAALNKVGVNPASWDKGGNNPITHLESLQNSDGGYWWVAPGVSEWNNKAMTAFAVIALANKSFPVAYYKIPEPTPMIHLIIMGQAGIICDIDISANNAMDAVINASQTCSYTYKIIDASFGPYLNQINKDAAEGVIGWLYYVNKESPMMGADQYELSEGDEVLWYFGEWGWDNITLEQGGNSEIEVTVLQPISIIIPNSVTDATINVCSLTNDNNNNTTATLPKITLSVITNLSGSPIKVVIPDNTIITAPAGWNGIINAPKIMANDSVVVKPDSGNTAAVSSVIEIGSGDTELLFNKAVRILIPEAAGKYIGYSRNGNFKAITKVCSADNQAIGNALTAGTECKINVGNDLIIWTKHFTKFVVYTQSPITSSASITPYTSPNTNSTAISAEEQEDACQEDCTEEDNTEQNAATSTDEFSFNIEESEIEILGIKVLGYEAELVGDFQASSEVSIITSGDVNRIVAELGLRRNLSLEKNYSQTIVAKIIKGKKFSGETQNSITNFITYGTKTTEKLGAGERAGVVNSYKSVFSKLPESEEDWNDAIKIAKGELPNKENALAEVEAKEIFKKVYKRDTDRTNANDDLAIKMIAYGLRPAERTLSLEREGVSVFQAIYGYNPSSAIEWDTVRALAYSGASR
ncbi:MAG: DUF4430 domain-containing protein [Patescibacteria group bacterium]